MTCSGMRDFAAIDFETANNERASVCSVGVVIVRGGEIEDKFYSLIKPEPEYYKFMVTVWQGVRQGNAPSTGRDRRKACCKSLFFILIPALLHNVIHNTYRCF